MLRKLALWTLVLTIAFFGEVLAAEPPTFTLDALAPSTQEVTLTVPQSGSLPLRILHIGGSLPTGLVDLSLSEFTGPQGTSVPLTMTIDGSGRTALSLQQDVPYRQALLSLRLLVP